MQGSDTHGFEGVYNTKIQKGRIKKVNLVTDMDSEVNSHTKVYVNITVTSWGARWRLKSPASPLFTQVFIQAQMAKKKSKLRVTGFCV